MLKWRDRRVERSEKLAAGQVCYVLLYRVLLTDKLSLRSFSACPIFDKLVSRNGLQSKKDQKLDLGGIYSVPLRVILPPPPQVLWNRVPEQITEERV